MRNYRRHQPQGARLMSARRAGTCVDTGKPFAVGATILWDPVAGVAYGPEAQRTRDAQDQQRANDWNAAHCMADAHY